MCKDDKVLTALQMEMVGPHLHFLRFWATSDFTLYYLSPFLCIFKLITALRVVGYVKWMIARCKLLQ